MDRRNQTLIIFDRCMHADIKCAKALKKCTRNGEFFFTSSLKSTFYDSLISREKRLL